MIDGKQTWSQIDLKTEHFTAIAQLQTNASSPAEKCLGLSSQGWIAAVLSAPSVVVWEELDDELGPSLIKEDSHVVSRFANRAVVLVENLTVAEHQVHILTKLVP